MNRLLSVLLLALAASVAPLAAAADLAPDGALARWLDDEAGPELARSLARHPRVAGEAVAFAAVADGVVLDVPDALRAAIERRLRRHLISTRGVRLALPPAADACTPASSAELLIGVDVRRSGRRGGELTLGLLDIAEGLWVPGVALSWRGQLAEEERAALLRASSAGVLGTPERPFERSDVARMAEALHARIACAAPPVAAGPTFVDVDLASVDAPLAAAFRAHFAGSARWTPVSDPGAARWTLRLRGSGQGDAGLGPAGVEALRVSLTEADGERSQLVAVVYAVPGATAPGLAAAAPGPARPNASVPISVPAVTAAHAGPRLLGETDVDVVRRQGVCAREYADGRCVEVSMELERDAWLVVATTRDGRVHPLACTPPSARADAGERRWRLAVAASENGRPAAGLYVLATRDGSVARALSRVVSEAPGACGAAMARGDGPWIDVLARFVDAHRGQLDWRAVHLTLGADGRVAQVGP